MRIRRSLGAAAVALSVAMGGIIGSAGAVGAAPAASAAPAVLAGQFCKKADVGKIETADNGAQVQCRDVDGYNRWVVK